MWNLPFLGCCSVQLSDFAASYYRSYHHEFMMHEWSFCVNKSGKENYTLEKCPLTAYRVYQRPLMFQSTPCFFKQTLMLCLSQFRSDLMLCFDQYLLHCFKFLRRKKFHLCTLSSLVISAYVQNRDTFYYVSAFFYASELISKESTCNVTCR